MKYFKNPSKALKEMTGTANDSCIRANNNTLIENADKSSEETQLERICRGSSCALCQANEGIIKGDISRKAQLHEHCLCQLIVVLNEIAKQKLADSLEVPDKKDIKAIEEQLAKARDWGLIEYEKPLEVFPGSSDERDLIAHLLLVKKGWSFKVLKEDAPISFSNVDILAESKKWEIKSPQGASRKLFEENLRTAIKQFEKNYPSPIDEANIIFNNIYTKHDDITAIKELKNRKHMLQISNILLIGKDCKITTI